MLRLSLEVRQRRSNYRMQLLNLAWTDSKLAALVAGLLWLAPVTHAQDRVIDEIVAIVADDIILKSEIDAVLANAIQQQRLEYSDLLWSQALEQLIDQKVMAEAAKRDTNLTVTEDQIDQSLDERIDMLSMQIGSEALLEETFGKTVEQIRADLREDFRDRLLAEQLQGQKMRAIKVTPSEVRDWFSQFPTDSLPTLPDIIRVAHIVRHPEISPEAEADAFDIISTIRDSIVTGTSSLEDMARRYSDDPGSANSGGRYREMALGGLVPEFAAVASRIAEDSLSAPFRSPFGYHVLRVNDRRGETIDFSHVLISVDQSDTDPTDAIAYLTVLRDSILTGKISFEVLARRHSEEATSAEIGGRLIDPSTGERDLFLEALGPDWRAVIDTMEVEELSSPAPVTLLDGTQSYHIVLLQRRVPAHRVDIETDYARIEQLALEEKRNREMRQWLDSLRENVYVETRGQGRKLLEKARADGSLPGPPN